MCDDEDNGKGIQIVLNQENVDSEKDQTQM